MIIIMFGEDPANCRAVAMKLSLADYVALAQAKERNLMCRATKGPCSSRDSQRQS